MTNFSTPHYYGLGLPITTHPASLGLSFDIRAGGHLLSALGGDAYGSRTRVTAVKGRCLNDLTNAPFVFVVI